MTEKGLHLGVTLFNDDFREDLIEKKQMRFVR
jgi:hypothetical protein